MVKAVKPEKNLTLISSQLTLVAFYSTLSTTDELGSRCIKVGGTGKYSLGWKEISMATKEPLH